MFRHRFSLFDGKPSFELPLLMFTTLLSLTVSTLLIIIALRFHLEFQELSRFYTIVLYNLWLVVAVALIASIFHATRNRISIYRILSNLKKSWLSREVSCSSILFILLAAYPLLYHYGKTLMLQYVHDLATAAVATITLFLMVKAYMMISRPSWNHVTILASSFLAAFLLGFSFLGSTYVIYYAILKKFSMVSDPTFILYCKIASSFIIIAVIARFFVQIFYFNHLKRSGPAAQVSMHAYLYEHRILLLFRFTLASALAMLALVSLLYIYNWRIEVLIATSITLQFILALTEVILERMLFYLTKSPPAGLAKIFELYIKYSR